MQKRMAIILALSITVSIVPAAAAPPQSASVNALRKEKQAKQSEAEKVKNDIVKKSAEIMNLNEELVRVGEKRIEAEKELEAAKIHEAEQEKSMCAQIVYMYEHGCGTNFIENIIESKSMSEFVNRVEYASEVQSYNKEQLLEYTAAKKRVAQSTAELKKHEKDLESKQDVAKKKETELQHIYDTKQNEIAEVEDEIQEEIRRIAAEEAARKAREEAEHKEKARQKAIAQQKRKAAKKVEKASKQQEKRNSDTPNSNSVSQPKKATEQPVVATPQPAPQPAAVQEQEQEQAPERVPAAEPKPEVKPVPQEPAPEKPANGNVSAQNAILAAARSQLGVPYVWGGTAAGVGLDCSGLVQYCYGQAGISLPRVSQSQGTVGVRVESPQAGDMVCYGHHIGIYIGSGQMIHAPQPNETVCVTNVYGSPWYMRAW